MRMAEETREATFVRRQNRFCCLVELRGDMEEAYLPNSGRLQGVLSPGQRVLLAERPSPLRRTKYDLVAASSDGTLVSVDARAAEELVREALHEGALQPFARFSSIRREVPRGRSRLDFLLTSPDSQCFLEVKSVTLAQEGRALFPDAPTPRGRKHVETLTWARRDGYSAAMIFVIQRGDVESFWPNDAVDPQFGLVLRTAQLRGIEVYAYRCKVTPEEIKLADQVPVCL